MTSRFRLGRHAMLHVRLASIVVLLVACVRPQLNSAARPEAGRSTAEDVAAISRVAVQFSALYVRGDAASMAALYTDDGVIFPGGRPMIRGKADITGYWTLPSNIRMIEHKTTADSVIVVGNTAYDYGVFYSRSSRDGQPGTRGYGKYVIVWRREAGGEWRMHLDIWNGSPAPQAPGGGQAPSPERGSR